MNESEVLQRLDVIDMGSHVFGTEAQITPAIFAEASRAHRQHELEPVCVDTVFDATSKTIHRLSSLHLPETIASAKAPEPTNTLENGSPLCPPKSCRLIQDRNLEVAQAPLQGIPVRPEVFRQERTDL